MISPVMVAGSIIISDGRKCGENNEKKNSEIALNIAQSHEKGEDKFYGSFVEN
jgi:hypothetical protein